MKLIKKMLSVPLMLLAGQAWSGYYETNDYLIDVERHCPEGYVMCDNISYYSRHKTTGKRMWLSGETIYRKCGDGITPCQFLGYRFKKGDITYLLLDSGSLQVLDGNNDTLFEQQVEFVTGEREICTTSRKAPIDLVPDDQQYKDKYQLQVSFDGQFCRQSELEIKVIDSEGESIYLKKLPFSLFIMHDSPEERDLPYIAERVVNEYLNNIRKPVAWRDFNYTSHESGPSYEEFAKGPKAKMAQLEEQIKSSTPQQAEELNMQINELFFSIEDEMGPVPGFDISKSDYDRLKSSGANLFSVHTREGSYIYWVFDKKNGKIVTVSTP